VVRRWREGFSVAQLSRRGLGDLQVDPDVKTADLVHGDVRSMTDRCEFFRVAFLALSVKGRAPRQSRNPRPRRSPARRAPAGLLPCSPRKQGDVSHQFAPLRPCIRVIRGEPPTSSGAAAALGFAKGMTAACQAATSRDSPSTSTTHFLASAAVQHVR
jgi:hypothetical protein